MIFENVEEWSFAPRVLGSLSSAYITRARQSERQARKVDGRNKDTSDKLSIVQEWIECKGALCTKTKSLRMEGMFPAGGSRILPDLAGPQSSWLSPGTSGVSVSVCGANPKAMISLMCSAEAARDKASFPILR